MSKMHDIIAYAKYGKYSALKAALKDGVDPNFKDEGNWTPLHWAAQEGHLEVVLALIASGAEVSPVDDLGFTPLAIAVGQGQDEIVRVLLDAGSSANQRIHGNDNGTVMHTACAWNRFEVVKVLIEHSHVDLNARDATGRTPLDYALEAEDDRLVSYLVKHGAKSSHAD